MNGQIVPDRKEELLRKKFLQSLKEGQLLQAKWGRPESLRTTQMNKYLFGVVYKHIAEELGYSVEEVHELMKYKFLRDRKLIAGEEVDYLKSTTNLTIEQFTDYWTKIKAWAKRFLNVDIPEPNQVDYDKLNLEEEM